MNKILIYAILTVLTIVALGIILIVGLDIKSCMIFGQSDNADNINNVLLNLSYSYIAGCIFFFFVTFLPEFSRKKIVQYAIAYKVSNLYYKSESLLRYLNNTNTHPELSFSNWNRKDLDAFLSGKKLNNKLFDGNDIFDETVCAALNIIKSEIVSLIDSIMNYSSFLTEKQIVLLTQISCSELFLLLNFRNGNESDRSLLNVDLAKFVDFKEALFELGILVIDLNKTIDPQIFKKLGIRNSRSRIFTIEE